MTSLKAILFVLSAFLAVASSAQTIKGTYAIRNVASGSQLRIEDAKTANGTPIVLYSPVEWKCMTWEFKEVDGPVYQLKNLFSGKSLQPVPNAAAGGTLEEEPLVDSASQWYAFEKAGTNTYRIKSQLTGLYLTAATDEQGKYTRVVLAEGHQDKTQQWTLHAQNPKM